MQNYGGTRVFWDNRSARTSDTCFGQVIYQPGGFCGPRIQRDFQLVLVHTGRADIKVDKKRQALPPGYLARFLPGHHEYFQFSTGTQTHHSWCTVTKPAMPMWLARELARTPFCVPCSTLFTRLFSSAFTVPARTEKKAEPVINQLGILMFTEFVRIAQAHDEKSGRSESLNKALAYIEDHLADEDCLMKAREVSGISYNALSHHFNDELGLPPSRYLWRLRTEKGVAMLAETGLTISEIAYKCGFQNPFHFSRLVKQQQGASPREIRKRAWARDSHA